MTKKRRNRRNMPKRNLQQNAMQRFFRIHFFLRKKRKRNVIKEELKVIIRKSVQFLLNEFLKEQESNAVN
jgi:hypothetical protein